MSRVGSYLFGLLTPIEPIKNITVKNPEDDKVYVGVDFGVNDDFKWAWRDANGKIQFVK